MKTDTLRVPIAESKVGHPLITAGMRSPLITAHLGPAAVSVGLDREGLVRHAAQRHHLPAKCALRETYVLQSAQQAQHGVASACSRRVHMQRVNEHVAGRYVRRWGGWRTLRWREKAVVPSKARIMKSVNIVYFQYSSSIQSTQQKSCRGRGGRAM